jgi:hypothetical protein
MEILGREMEILGRESGGLGREAENRGEKWRIGERSGGVEIDSLLLNFMKGFDCQYVGANGCPDSKLGYVALA